jgi:hypothetical protein
MRLGATQRRVLMSDSPASNCRDRRFTGVIDDAARVDPNFLELVDPLAVTLFEHQLVESQVPCRGPHIPSVPYRNSYRDFALPLLGRFAPRGVPVAGTRRPTLGNHAPLPPE